MSLSGTTLFARISMDPDCELQALLGLDRSRNEKEFYHAVVGVPFQGEWGERESARSRGAKFERNILHPPGYARLLREAVAPIVGVAAEDIVLRDLENEEPGGSQGNRLQRVKLTRSIMRDSTLRGQVTHVIVKPTLVLNTGFAPGDVRHRYIEPDFLVWSASRGTYVPGDFKSFVVRDGVVDADKLERVRLQLSCDVIALRDELRRIQVGLETAVESSGYLIFATPFGLQPDEPRLEDLRGGVEAVLRGVAAFRQHRARIIAAAKGAPLITTAPDLKSAYQEKCIATCIMADYCRNRVADTPAVLGDAAYDLLGETHPLPKVIGLMRGTITPENEEERQLVSSLRAAAGLPRIRRRAG